MLFYTPYEQINLSHTIVTDVSSRIIIKGGGKGESGGL